MFTNITLVRNSFFIVFRFSHTILYGLYYVIFSTFASFQVAGIRRIAGK